MPRLERAGKGAPLVLRREVDDRRRAAADRRPRAGGEIVRRRGDAVIHVEMGVRVDEAGKDEAARRVVGFAPVGGQARPDGGDLSIPHEDVRREGVFGRHHPAVLNEQCHMKASC